MHIVNTPNKAYGKEIFILLKGQTYANDSHKTSLRWSGVCRVAPSLVRGGRRQKGQRDLGRKRSRETVVGGVIVRIKEARAITSYALINHQRRPSGLGGCGGWVIVWNESSRREKLKVRVRARTGVLGGPPPRRRGEERRQARVRGRLSPPNGKTHR